MEITKVRCPDSQIPIKCPYSMTPKYITVHNTANDASAMAEISYMLGNPHEVSYHAAIDDYRVVEGISEARNTWACGDGAHGTGNRESIHYEICYSKSGGSKFETSEMNAAKYIAMKLRNFGWGIDRVKKHQDWNGKYCPHRTLDLGWIRFINLIEKELNNHVADQILYVGSKVIFNGVFKANESLKPTSKYKNGAVGCYNLCYGYPVGPDDYIPCGPLAKCNADGSNADYNAIIYPGDYFKCDKQFTVLGVEPPTSYTKNGVAILEADGVRFRCDCGPLQELSNN